MGCILAVPSSRESTRSTHFSTTALKSFDYFGALLLLAASTLLVFALQEAGSSAFAWESAAIIASFTISGVCWLGFVVWIWRLDSLQNRAGWPQPIVPLRLFLSRPTGPAIL